MVKTAESMAIDVIRKLMLACRDERVVRVSVHVNDEVAAYLNNKKRKELANLEDRGGMTVQIYGRASVYPEALQIQCFDANEREIEAREFAIPGQDSPVS